VEVEMNRTAPGTFGLTGLPAVDAHLIRLAELHEEAGRNRMPLAAPGRKAAPGRAGRLRRRLAVAVRPALPSV
jgi:hypothetical protein